MTDLIAWYECQREQELEGLLRLRGELVFCETDDPGVQRLVELTRSGPICYLRVFRGAPIDCPAPDCARRFASVPALAAHLVQREGGHPELVERPEPPSGLRTFATCIRQFQHRGNSVGGGFPFAHEVVEVTDGEFSHLSAGGFIDPTPWYGQVYPCKDCARLFSTDSEAAFHRRTAHQR
ncbi:MAG: hypothetical protein AB7I38_13365 [Dehalococcoidia bacterium]